MITFVELRIAITGDGAHVGTVPMRMLSRLVAAYLGALHAVAEANAIDLREPTADGSHVREGSSCQALVADPNAARAAELLNAMMFAPSAPAELQRPLRELAAAARGLRSGWGASVSWGDRGYVSIPDKAPPAMRSAEITTRPTRITGHNRERGPSDTPVIYATDATRDINYAVETDADTALRSVQWEAAGVQVDLRMELRYSASGAVSGAKLIKVEQVRGRWNVADTLAWFGEEFSTA